MNMNRTQFVKYISNLGYTESNNRKPGSHRIYQCSGKPPLSIPEGELSPGVKRNLIKLVSGDAYYQK